MIMTGAEITSEEARRAFMLAGNATFTVRSKTLDVRFVYEIKAPNGDIDAKILFVRVLHSPGSRCGASYVYVGFVSRGEFKHGGVEAKLDIDAPSVKAFAWLMRNLGSDKVEVWHEGGCGRCEQNLTVPESIESGICHVCSGLMN